MNSREKGKRGERELAEWLRERGIEARRGVQYQGGDDSPDVVTALPGVHFECKRTERLAIYPAVEQAVADAGERLPVVAFRSNRREWLAVVPLERLRPWLLNPARYGTPLDQRFGLAYDDARPLIGSGIASRWPGDPGTEAGVTGPGPASATPYRVVVSARSPSTKRKEPENGRRREEDQPQEGPRSLC